MAAGRLFGRVPIVSAGTAAGAGPARWRSGLRCWPIRERMLEDTLPGAILACCYPTGETPVVHYSFSLDPQRRPNAVDDRQVVGQDSRSTPERERQRLSAGVLPVQLRDINGVAMNAWRCASLEANEREPQLLKRLGEGS